MCIWSRQRLKSQVLRFKHCCRSWESYRTVHCIFTNFIHAIHIHTNSSCVRYRGKKCINVAPQIFLKVSHMQTTNPFINTEPEATQSHLSPSANATPHTTSTTFRVNKPTHTDNSAPACLSPTIRERRERGRRKKSKVQGWFSYIVRLKGTESPEGCRSFYLAWIWSRARTQPQGQRSPQDRSPRSTPSSTTPCALQETKE